jgi:hypothetical protein
VLIIFTQWIHGILVSHSPIEVCSPERAISVQKVKWFVFTFQNTNICELNVFHFSFFP